MLLNLNINRNTGYGLRTAALCADGPADICGNSVYAGYVSEN